VRSAASGYGQASGNFCAASSIHVGAAADGHGFLNSVLESFPWWAGSDDDDDGWAGCVLGEAVVLFAAI
jgi:hypothetical protein